MIKRFALLLFSAVVIFALPGCTDSKKAKLKAAVEEADKLCPVNLGSVGDLINMKYDEEMNEVQFYYTISEDAIFNIDYIDDNKEMMSQSIRLALSKSDQNEVLKTMTEAKARLKAVYKGTKSGKSTDITIYPFELEQILKKPISDHEIDETMLKNELAAIQKSLPMRVEEGMYIDRVFDDGDNIVYVYKMDENLYDVSLLESNMAEMRSELLDSFESDFTVKRLMSILVNLDKGFMFRYEGDRSGTRVDVRISPSELRDFLRRHPLKIE